MRTPPVRSSLVFLSACLFLTLPAVAAAAVSASTVTSSGQLLNGSVADGQIGDLVLANDEIIVIISGIGHITHDGENGGTVIDAGTTAANTDALGELYTYFDDDWPRQAVYTSLVIIDDGSGGGPAVIRASGHDLNDSGQAVVTDYSLADGDRHLTVTTQVTGSGAAQPDFELGDAFHWGTCSKYAPGLGFAIDGTTTQAWMVGKTGDVCYAYAGIYGDCWGPNGSYWSDINVTTADLSGGATVSYTRYLAVASGEIAAAVSILHEALGVATGSVICNVSSLDDGTPLPGALVNVFDGSGNPYYEMIVGGVGQALGTLPTGTWRLVASATGYQSVENWVTVYEGASHGLDFQLPSGGGGISEAIGDTLTIIQRPLVNIPALVTPGQTLEISCAADPATTGWQAEISHEALTLPLTVTAAAYDPATEWWTLSTTVPAVPLYELFDLRVTADGGLDDTTRHAVRVLDQFKDDFYFIHITDTHLPDHKFSDSGGTPADSTETVDLRAVIQDINLINPEFVLITGDFINEGELEDYLEWRCYTRAQRQLYEFTTPTFLVAGNHDLGGWEATPPSDGTARRDWWRFFGWPRLDNPPPGAPEYTQSYSFDYGPVHFVGLEAYNNYDMWRAEIYGTDSFPAAQMAWLNQDLAAASGSQTQVLFYHKDFQNQIDLGALGVEMALWGHVHGDRGSELIQPYDLGTNNVCDGSRSYRLIRVSGGVLQPIPTLSAGGSGQNLRVDYTPANVGLSETVIAQITNNQTERFEHGRLRFVMPANGGHYVATGGQVVQIDQSGEHDVCHVAVDILASGTQTVTVSPDLSSVPGAGLLADLRLDQNIPNPFNPATDVKYHLPVDGSVRLAVYDMKGRQVAVLVDQVLLAGDHAAHWNGRDKSGRDAPSGVYFLRLSIPGQERTRKMVLAR
ncbi:MAG: metallophosphoesterase [Candidatus Krumholzibacteriota bacterium]